MKRYIALSTILLVSFVFSGKAIASDNTDWINKCIADNKSQGREESVVIAYCACMNNSMSSTETRSISEWEVSADGKAANATCSAQAGWK